MLLAMPVVIREVNVDVVTEVFVGFGVERWMTQWFRREDREWRRIGCVFFYMQRGIEDGRGGRRGLNVGIFFLWFVICPFASGVGGFYRMEREGFMAENWYCMERESL